MAFSFVEVHPPISDCLPHETMRLISATLNSPPDSQPSNHTSGELDWTGPDDPDIPHNWSQKKKVYHTAVTALFAFTV